MMFSEQKVDFISVTLIYFTPPTSKFIIAIRSKFGELILQ